ncbi:ATP-binding protein [Limnoglobus roseus]|uniref:histidine kinase n=1 Tax=Limnoglobus roseus TaxID=2598579 RepID=A0A5C1ADR0_9BACT|nr:ATP-binding protein [Limnoglobus roseus]QEL17509.1 histidine kinase [Limnoglobus roseus]
MRPDTLVSYESLFRFAADGFVVIDRSGLISLVNSRAEAMFGRNPGDLVGRRPEDLLTDHGRIAYANLVSAASGEPADLAFRREDGGTFVAEATVAAIGSPGDLALLALRDVTARKREEEALRARARQQGLVAELGRRALTGIGLGPLMDEAVTVLAVDLGVEFANLLELLPDGTAVFRAGVGWRAGLVRELTVELRPGTPAGQVVLDQAPVLIEDLRADGRHPAPSVAREHGVVSSLTVPLYGQARPLGVLGVHAARPRPFPEADVHFVQAVANVVATAIERHRDEERLRERQMVRAEQMAAIGQVAAGVAHELRNPLTSIKGLVQVNLREADARGLPAEDLQVIDHEVRRMERTLQTFLDFARPPRPARQRLDLAEVIDRVFALVGGRAGKQAVALRSLRPAGPVGVDGDQDQIQQLALNLVLNALDALPHGGAVEVELRPPRDGHAEVLVRDTGPGIAAHILPKVFETFVSSKETGIGLGLPVSRRIAEDHGGTLSAYNLPAGGACFALRLPAPV